MKYILVLPVLFSAIVLGSSANAIAQSKTAATEIKAVDKKDQNAVKKKDDGEDLIKDLIKEKVLSGKEKNFDVKLSYEELVVNSKIMPEYLHKKMRAKYLGGNPRKTITYKVSSN